MIRPRSEMKNKKIEIDLNGPEGNAVVLMGYAKNFAKQMKIDHTPIIKDMSSGDYENLLNVFDREFGSFVTLYR